MMRGGVLTISQANSVRVNGDITQVIRLGAILALHTRGLDNG